MPAFTSLLSATALYSRLNVSSQAASILYLISSLAVYGPLDIVAAGQVDSLTIDDISDMLATIAIHAVPACALTLIGMEVTSRFSIDHSLTGSFIGVLKAAQWCTIISIV